MTMSQIVAWVVSLIISNAVLQLGIAMYRHMAWLRKERKRIGLPKVLNEIQEYMVNMEKESRVVTEFAERYNESMSFRDLSTFEQEIRLFHAKYVEK